MQCIAFDIGNVLCHFNIDEFYNKSVENHSDPVSSKELIKDLIESLEYLDYIGAATISTEIRKKFKNVFTEEQIEKIVDTWNKTVWPNEQMMNFISSLKYDNIKIALLSNMGRDHAAFLKNTYPSLFEVDVIHLSYEIGSFKPHKLFFQSFLMSHEEYAGCVYLDDKKENIVSAAKMKFNAVHFDLDSLTQNQPPSTLKRKLKEIKDKMSKGY